MKTTCLAISLAFGVLTLSASAQNTNDLNTTIGRFESRLDVIIGKGFGDVGNLSFGSGEVRVRTRESQNLTSGEKVYGLSVEWRENNQSLRILVDDNELDDLINAVNRLTTIRSDEVTTLPGFEASFTTKAGLRVIAHRERKDGTVLTYLQFEDCPRISLPSVQIQQLGILLQQGRKNLDFLKAGK